ncbi:LytR/AlgR family response regulator transcription factor [Chryseolinea lacunae]|uniref:LytTR family transcriptional regulator DNA-binding domain-containing protein n=1 Tax=Chryseolinea lacunae TaxID=2801331 RepID=A0ABS1L2F7_9BACT|nr:LytTR family DNA-binding domain-containing protein [Chryseolinea lacunae]MBL0745633.1 LytTR family transcriptional regulator DNA-binding domain-containing protein [Chryseolinea lacunae]
MAGIISWFRQPFKLLDSHRARWQLVIFCGVFGCVFLNVFHPFNMNEWFSHVKAPMFAILTFFSAAGMAALALTQFVFRALFRVELTTRIGFFAWLLLEFFFISVAVHTVNIILLQLPFINLPEYLVTLKYTLMVLVLPYFLAILLLFVQEQLITVEELTIKINKSQAPESVTINDENGKIVVRMPAGNILYFKSEDNYIFLYYKSDTEVKKELIRNTLKKLEQELNLPNFIRIHRSYMINTQNLVSILRTSQGYRVRMDASPGQMLMVSATYQQAFEDRVVQQGA